MVANKRRLREVKDLYNESKTRKLLKEIYEFLETRELDFPEGEEGKRQIIVNALEGSLEGFRLIKIIFGEDFLPKSLRAYLMDCKGTEIKIDINLARKQFDFGENADRRIRFVRLPLLQLIRKILPEIVKKIVKKD